MIAKMCRSQGDEVLNLCFHGIGTPGRPLEPDEELYWVEEAQFEELLEVIASYPSVRITFDDGNASDAALALPALRRHNLKATFFIISGRLDQPGSLSSAEVRSLVQSGMTVGSHGMRHVSWRSISDQELHEELTALRTPSPMRLVSRSGRWPAHSAPTIGACSTPSAATGSLASTRWMADPPGATHGCSPATPSGLMTLRQTLSVGRARRAEARSRRRAHRQVVRKAMAVGRPAEPRARTGPWFLIGFAEAMAAIETAWSLQGAGFKVVAFRRAGSRPALRRARGVEIHDVPRPELDAAATVAARADTL